MNAEEQKEGESQNSHASTALQAAQEDLRNASFHGLLGKLFHPVREDLLIPLVGQANEIVPGIAKAIPFVDPVAGFALGTTFSLFKFGYSLLPHVDESLQEEASDEVQHEMDDLISLVHDEKMKQATPNILVSSLLSAFGFVSNTILDLLTFHQDHKWREWLDAIVKLFAYLIFSGIDKELANAFLNLRAPENGIIIARIESSYETVDTPTTRRNKTAFPNMPIQAGAFKEIIKDSSV